MTVVNEVTDSFRLAVVGHVEWVEFAVVERLPRPGEIVQATESWDEPAGGGAVAAVQIAKLAGDCLFFTATGNDSLGGQVAPELERRGVSVRAATRESPQRRAFVHLESSGERTITTLGPRLLPLGSDDLGWDEMTEIDAVYVTAGDEAAIRAARQARQVVATVRAAEGLIRSGILVDALVASRNDPGEQVDTDDFETPPAAVVRTDGSHGGAIEMRDGETIAWQAAPPPADRVDAYGAGDSFAGALTFGLGIGLALPDAVSLAAFCGARNVTGRGPYAGQADAKDLAEWRAVRNV
jgi:ribokinase